ncbi:Tetratricopeptide repeat-containing domain [Macleaya cordata]|uniref:Tetratricopeptide repeat-containing domain n=1 Tax=Macleaya cordata TaxID=56857 RepID=A0A200PWL4_MACCD|nr:Tetratricopeptide repeat-containing domain [Macleaya cordata]
MVGDIFGKSWGSAAPSGSTTRLGIPEKNPNLFGDLVGSALGQGKGNSNVPLKNATPVQTKSSYSMGNLADSLPKNTTTMKNNSNLGSGTGSFSSVQSGNNNGMKTGNLGGPSMRSGGSAGSANKDPFESLVGFGSKKEPVGNANAASRNVSSTGDYSFGDFQDAAKSSTAPSFPSNPFPTTNNNSMASSAGSGSKTENFGAFDIPIQDFSTQKQPPPQSKGVDPLDMLFSSSTGSAPAVPGGSNSQNQLFSEVEDWGNLGPQFGGDDAGSTTELEGLPPPPAGVTASAAKNKGLDSQKQGQHADAIKWLSWAVVLLEKSGDNAATVEVLSSRASCYKEVGEYKKAVADCSKVLEHDPANVSILVQRALLYESTEKYRLGAEDLRAVLKIDPGNRLARSTIHRLTKMAD